VATSDFPLIILESSSAAEVWNSYFKNGGKHSVRGYGDQTWKFYNCTFESTKTSGDIYLMYTTQGSITVKMWNCYSTFSTSGTKYSFYAASGDHFDAYLQGTDYELTYRTTIYLMDEANRIKNTPEFCALRAACIVV
ncbi:unnamed protein product, partial [marine sediment metagenome]